MALSLLRIIISFTFWQIADGAIFYFKGLLDINLEMEEIHGFYRPKYYLYTNLLTIDLTLS